MSNVITFAEAAAIAKRVNAMPYWYHRIELPGGLVTPGWAPLDPSAYRIPADLSGKRVLDIGAWDGYWSFEALKRGATEVVAIDDFSDFLGNLEEEDRPGWDTFELCREILGHDEERCQHHDMSLYDLTEERFGRFDLVFCFGVLYHLRHPLLGLDRIAALAEEVYLETAILDDYSAYRGGIGKGYGSETVMEFYPKDEYGNNPSNWWVPSLACLTAMLEAAGFGDIETWKLVDQPGQVSDCRGFARAKKT